MWDIGTEHSKERIKSYYQIFAQLVKIAPSDPACPDAMIWRLHKADESLCAESDHPWAKDAQQDQQIIKLASSTFHKPASWYHTSEKISV